MTLKSFPIKFKRLKHKSYIKAWWGKKEGNERKNSHNQIIQSFNHNFILFYFLFSSVLLCLPSKKPTPLSFSYDSDVYVLHICDSFPALTVKNTLFFLFIPEHPRKQKRKKKKRRSEFWDIVSHEGIFFSVLCFFSSCAFFGSQQKELKKKTAHKI